MNQRVKFATKGINISTQVGLELGPLTMPTVKKGKGAKIFYLDHLSTGDLKEKYKNEPITLKDIVDVDFVMDGTIKESVNNKKFDYVIASHVIEHIPNTIEWIHEIDDVLKPGGYLSLVIPDKRYTFDIFRNVSEPSAVIGAYIDNIKRFTSESVYDASLNYMRNIDAPSVWRDPEYYNKIKPKARWTAKEALDMAQRSAKGEYVDTHCYVYTPVSFLKILKNLIEGGFINFTLENFNSTPENELEFYIILKKIPKYTSEIKRKELAKINRLIKTNTQRPVYLTKITELENENEILRTRISLMANSVSWKVTQPLRTASKYRIKQ